MIFLTLCSLVFCVGGIGLGSLASWDEAYYALVSRGIHLSNDWIHLTYFDTSFYDKPPLYFWTTALFYRIFGVTEFASRLTSALAGVGVILCTYAIGKRLLGKTAALAGAGILLSSTDFLQYARWGTLDITHLFFFSMAILFYLKTTEEPGCWVIFWLMSALAVLTKGPLIVLAAPILLFDMIARRDLSFVQTKAFWGGLALFAATVIPWHLAVYLADPQKFMADIVYKHYVSRTTTAVEGHTGNWYFYIRTLINKFHPWIILAPAALPWAFWRARKESAYRLLLFWALLVFCFFTFLIQTKLKWYILLLHPALSLILGAFAAEVVWKRAPKPELWIKITIVAALVLHIPFSSVMVQDHSPGLKKLAGAVKVAVPENRPVFLYQFHEEPAAKFYLKRPVRYADSWEELAMELSKSPQTYLVVPEEKYPALVHVLDEAGFKKLFETRDLKTDLVFLARG
jgi:4-amino-4-deoxy-L-arabinose transferase-like glycosyltransferase